MRVYHMYGLTEMSVWQVMTRLETAEMLEEMPVYVPGHNLLSDTAVDCNDGQIEVRSENRQCWIRDRDKSRFSIEIFPLIM